ncbi:hypothetical protein AB6A40_008070 [Gnathostoma spinigerum]|uniref:Uncharacterized protein n=1 Tax=Gnathostoma spinigerum TaxID=75299 RepID=A0ABD6EQ03_9BILA
MTEQGKLYSQDGHGKQSARNAIIRQALTEVFSVSKEQIKEFEKKVITLHPGSPMSVMMQALAYYDREWKMVVETWDSKPAEAGSKWVAKVLLDGKIEIEGTYEESKAKAKDSCATKVITEELGLDMPTEESLSIKRAVTMLSPSYTLHQLMAKSAGTEKPDIVYTEVKNTAEGTTKTPSFTFTVTLNGKSSFTGTGPSKKAARNAAAEIALREVFKHDMASGVSKEVFSPRKIKLNDGLNSAVSLHSLVRLTYENLCQSNQCPMTSHTAAFVIVDRLRHRRVVAIGAGSNAVIGGKLLMKNPGNVLIHMQSVVLARRAFLLYLLDQLEHLSDVTCILEASSTPNKYRLKSGYDVILYSAFPPNTSSQKDTPQKFSCYMGSPVGSQPVPDHVQTFEEMDDKPVHVMSVADKIFKWNELGLQGALLSYLFEPVKISQMVIGAYCNEAAVKRAVYDRFGKAMETDASDGWTVKSALETIRQYGMCFQNWIVDQGPIERIDPFSGQAHGDTPSRICKAEIVKRWMKTMRTLEIDIKVAGKNYAEMKHAQHEYKNDSTRFFDECQSYNLGKWQRKDVRVDNFAVLSDDNEPKSEVKK